MLQSLELPRVGHDWITEKLQQITYVEPKKYNKLVNITKKKQTQRYTEQNSGYQWQRAK